MKNLLSTFTLFALAVSAQSPHITTPKEVLGFNVGDDYQMASYAQLESWWKKLASESNRMKLVDIGLTAEGRHQYMAILSSPENLKKLDHYREISRRLALAEGLSDDEARKLATEGKAVVWIDGGLHATETVGSQQLMEWVYQMVSRDDPETQRFLHDVILLCVPNNPDGQDLVANWYMRDPDPKKRTLSGLPRLYEKYAGHDDNRDFYMSNLPETTNTNRILYREWFPQIMYNHHQTGPRGGVVFIPPFRDPFNYNYDPLIVMQIEQLGTAMHSRLIAEGKYGSGMRSVSTYSTWYNGGLRTTTYFHNMIGLLTEIIGSPAPTQIPLVPERQLPTGDLPAPITSRYDVLVFMDGAIRSTSGGRRGGAGMQPRADSIPEENRAMLGRITSDKTIPQIRKFIEAGGDVVTVGGSTSLAGMLGLPIRDALTERGSDGTEHALARDKFYVPGSVLRATVDASNPLAYGFTGTVDVFFDNDPVYKLSPEAASKGISSVAWFSGTEPLRSGWAWGQQYLDGGVAIAEASVGEGKLFLLGPEVTFRAQPHGTFKFLFNGIYYGTAKSATLAP